MNSSLGQIDQSWEDEYPIIWFQPEINIVQIESFEKNKSIAGFFCKLQEAVDFAESLGISFLMIVPKDFDEYLLLEALKTGIDGRKLTSFEEESIFEQFCMEEEARKSFKVYVFFTYEDFESEIFVEEDAMEWNVEEFAREFRKEFIFRERKSRGLEKEDAIFGESQGSEEILEDKDYARCKAFSINRLKVLAKTRKAEKSKLMYFVNLGECCYKLKEYDSAVDYYREVLDLLMQIYGEKHPSIAYLFHRLADVYQDLDIYQDAVEYYRKAQDIRKSLCEDQNYGHQKADGHAWKAEEALASSYFEVGELFKNKKEYLKALQHQKKSLEVKTCIINQRAGSENYSCPDLEKYEKAFEYFSKRVFDPKRTLMLTASSYKDLGLVYKTLQQDQKAIGCYLKVLEMRESLPSQPVEFLFPTLFHLGELYENLKENEKALEYYQEKSRNYQVSFR